MPSDPTETIRREMIAELSAEPDSREYLEAKYGQLWDKDQVREDFEIIGFGAPFVVAIRKSDGQKGSLMFSGGYPRYYFSFEPHKP